MVKAKAVQQFSIVALDALVFSGCTGDTSASGTASGDGEGFECGASQEEVNAVIEDLDPVTLTYQPEATSPDSLSALGVEYTKMKLKRGQTERSPWILSGGRL